MTKNKLVIFKIFSLIISSYILSTGSNAQDYPGNSQKNLYTIDDETPIVFLIPNEKFHFSSMIDKSTNIFDAQKITFYPITKTSGFETGQYYIKKIIIKNRGSSEKRIGVTPDNDHPKSEFFLKSENIYKTFKNRPGTNQNVLSSVYLLNSDSKKSGLSKFTFRIKSGEVAEVYYKFQHQLTATPFIIR